MKVLIICPYPLNTVASQRFRFEQYGMLFERANMEVKVQPFFTTTGWEKFSQKGFLLSKLFIVFRGFWRRVWVLFKLSPVDSVFIHREATPFGPPFVEYVISKILKKRIIYDFDDAIWLTDNTSESGFHRFIRFRNKVGSICRWSYKISCGNTYLADYARKFNPHVFIHPTIIDTRKHSPISVKASTRKTTIGWTGSRSTRKYLTMLLPVMQLLENTYPEVQYIIIADEDPKLPLRNVMFIRWSKETEVQDLAQIDIGIMPLPDDPWTRGKCGFKALQYMALQIPAVVSPVGVNAEIVQHGVEGYWCTKDEEWYSYLEKLILSPQRRTEMGKRGRQKVIDRYSVSANADNFLSLFQ